MRAVIYARISRDREGAGLGVERQVQDCLQLATSLGMPNPDVLAADNDVSAWSGKRRRDYERLLTGLREGRWDTLIVWHIDRLTRSPRDLEDLADIIRAAKVRFHTVKGGEVDLSTPEGLLQAGILGQLARYESDHRSDRVKRKKLQLAQSGRDNGGQRRYGYSADQPGKLDAHEAAVVRDLTVRVIAGDPLYALARRLDADGVPPPRGASRWEVTAVRGLVRRCRNAGLVEYHGAPLLDSDGDYVEGDWETIVTVDQWRAACAVLADPTRRTSPGNTPAHLLSGIARCGIDSCGAPVRVGQSNRQPSYLCTVAHHLSRRVALVDRVVTDVVVDWLARSGATFDQESGPAVDHRVEIDAVRIFIAELEDALIGSPTERLEGASLEGVRRNLAKQRAHLDKLERTEVLATLPSPVDGVTAENFPGLLLERRRAVIAHLVDVVLLPGRGRGTREDSVLVTPKRR